MPEPTFIYHPTTPPDGEPTRFQVYVEQVPDVDDAFLGTVYQTADNGWVADWSKLNGTPSNAMPGFRSKQYAASALYWFAPPAQSARSRPAGQIVPMSDERVVDTSLCGCCINNRCECEGANRVSERYGTTQSYEVQPSLIPEHGVLVSLMPMPDGDFLVDFNTRDAGSGIGYLQRHHDGRYHVRMGPKAIGIAATPEAAMWAALRDHTGSTFYEHLTKEFVAHEKPIYTT
ncbi:hypothetical protein [Streptomyces acidiscabies]|uniref:Uncharacterized protein n=1 Tax=Streptomyces acidiscabies TaxID=42234 RepID=A0ABU4LWA7_9ACTN|nr:hypothetical protein [Streptomyces acidiscabies]MDX3020005.1 hypothetical protein [Streptomyces acidiscabies]